MDDEKAVSIDAQFNAFVDSQVKEGRYRGASDVVAAGLRLLEEQEARLTALRSALAAGEQSGISPHSALEIWAAVEGKEQSRQTSASI